MNFLGKARWTWTELLSITLCYANGGADSHGPHSFRLELTPETLCAEDLGVAHWSADNSPNSLRICGKPSFWPKVKSDEKKNFKNFTGLEWEV